MTPEGMSLGEAAVRAAADWTPLTPQHCPSVLRALRDAYAEGFMRGFNVCATMKPEQAETRPTVSPESERYADAGGIPAEFEE